MAIYGYIRVSTNDQNTARQFIAMKKLNIPDKNLYVVKRSRRDFNRPAYKCLIRRLKENYLLYIKSIDRLGKITREFKNSGGF